MKPEPTVALAYDVSGFVTVELPALNSLPPYRPKFAILKDKSAREIVAFAKAHPHVFVFPFWTKGVEEMPNYRRMMRRPLTMEERIVQPMYIGNLDPIDEAIRQIIAHALQTPIEECDEILND